MSEQQQSIGPAYEPAFAAYSGDGMRGQEGLTKREYFAGLAMQGLIANWGECHVDSQGVVVQAVFIADQLLVELAKPAEARHD